MTTNTIYGDDGNNTLIGAPGVDDTIYGYAGFDRLNGKGGNDTLIGGADNDYYYLYNDNLATIVENPDEGTDTVFTLFSYTLPDNIERMTLFTGAPLNGTGNGGDNILTGGTGNNILDGKGGNDVIHAQNGDDTLNGGAGVDKLYGEGGADTFVFDSTAYLGRDRVYGFSLAGGDKIELRGLLTGYTPGVSKITDFVRITQTASGNSYLYVDPTGAAGWSNFVQIARLDNITGLTDEAGLLASGNLTVTSQAI